MKIIQSFWTDSREIEDNSGGWIDSGYHLMGWCLSFLLLQKHFGKVHLVANSLGKELLYDKLKLPYASVDLALDESIFQREIWTLNKLKVFSLQKEPFLHFDGDAFLWRKPIKDFLYAPLVGQFIEIDEPIYKSTIDQSLRNKITFPSFMTNLNHPLAVNTGVVGGQNHQFFQIFYGLALTFINRYSKVIKKIDNPGSCNLAIVVEQCFYKYLADELSIPITLLLRPSFRSDSTHVVNFIDICNELNPAVFTHVMGFYKQRLFYCMQVESWLKFYFPSYHERVNSLFPRFKNKKIVLHPINAPEIPAIELIDDTLEQAIQNRWRRTKAQLSKLGIPESVLLGDLNILVDSWKVKKGTDDLIDCFTYERERYEKLEKRAKSLKQVSLVDYEKIFSIPISLRMNDQVQLSENALIFNSKKNWHRPEEKIQDAGETVYEAVVDPNTHYLQEFTQSELNRKLIKAIERTVSLNNLNNLLIESFPSMDPLLVLNRLDNKIRDLFMNGNLVYNNEI